MAYEVQQISVEQRSLAVVRDEVTLAEIPAAIRRLLDQVWPFLRQNQIRRDHNIVVYRDGTPIQIEAGVEVFDPLPEHEVVKPSTTPAGLAATTTHWGDYSGVGQAHQAIRAWCREQGVSWTGVNWEIYGDWFDDLTKVRTDIFYLLEPAQT